MKRLFIFFLFLIPANLLLAQNLQSPGEFLGYKPGTKFTPHYRIVEYFKAVAQAVPNMVKLEKYGETNEGRPLMVAYIASPENLQNLEAIRMNNLRLAGIAKDKMAPIAQGAPAIVWLSYNVHGNEPTSSEASMSTLFALVDPANTKTKEWLKNCVIIIDPCLNPDGRDRYVNWYNDVVGKHFNADPQAREHNEPWPRGRTNHYNFDLNRDWSWQTQAESKARMKLYNTWLPQVHIDFHEQSYDDPYFFPPAAEPFHEVITPWQREFQNLTGQNNAAHFDANNWLYFTRQEFDMFYPSYGDTYPTYNGAIGMTYEQGGIDAGLGVKTSTGDTLTLVDRVAHHLTTSLSTIETSSKYATRLVEEFKKFYDEDRNGANFTYKTYVLTSDDANKIKAVAELLDKNGIQYGTTQQTTFKGYHYFTGKEENYTAKKYQLAVSAFQPKSRYAKVLFEPRSTLSDSATYDITAWSIPYAYGVDAYAVKEKLDVGPFQNAAAIQEAQSDYGLLIPYTSFDAAKLLSYLLVHKVKVRFAEKAFTYNNKTYDAGTLIILKGNNIAGWNEITNDACKMFSLQADEVSSGFMQKGFDFGSDKTTFIHAPKVAMITGNAVSSESAGEVWDFFDDALQYPITLINSEDWNYTQLSDYDVVILPDGDYSFGDDKKAMSKIKTFLQQGGKVIGMESAAIQLANADLGFEMKESRDTDTAGSKTDYALLKKYGQRDRDYLKESIPGAIFKLDMDNTHPLAFGYPDFYYTLKLNSSLFSYMKNGWNVGALKKSNYTSGFIGSDLKPELVDGTLIGALRYGRGNIVFFADDPIFRLFWQNGKLLFSNAIFLVGQ